MEEAELKKYQEEEKKLAIEALEKSDGPFVLFTHDKDKDLFKLNVLYGKTFPYTWQFHSALEDLSRVLSEWYKENKKQAQKEELKKKAEVKEEYKNKEKVAEGNRDPFYGCSIKFLVNRMKRNELYELFPFLFFDDLFEL